jgi:uncharacterized RDD family membrane protein YckC
MSESDPQRHEASEGPPEERGGSAPRQAAGGPAPSWTQTLTSTAPVPGPAGLFYADVPNRIIAYIIDVIVLAIIGFVVALVLGGLFGGIMTTGEGAIGEATSDLNLLAFLVVGLGNLAISLAYFGYSWTALRATPGMRLLGLQLGDERDGRSIDWNQAFARWLVLGIPSILATFASYVSSGLGFILSLVGLVWLVVLLYSIAQSPTKQGIHDRLARTIMVKAGRRKA